MSKNILVTGGAGYVGSHTCKALKNADYNPIAYDNLSHGHKDFVQWGPLIEGDINNIPLLRQTLKQNNIAAVIHFAAFAYVGESMKKPEIYYRNNVAGSLSLLEAMLAENVKQIVFSSSCATYGIPLSLPITESTPQAPINPYGTTKLTVEKMLREFSMAHTFQTVALRYFNAAGASPEGEIGEDHNPETHLIPLAIKAALQNSPLTVFGQDYPTKDGTCIRDYIHVTDLADAHVKSLALLQQQKQGTAFEINLGNAEGYSILDIVASVERISGVKLNLIFGERREGDPPSLVAENSLAKSLLGWAPRHNNLDDIISSAWSWHQKRHST